MPFIAGDWKQLLHNDVVDDIVGNNIVGNDIMGNDIMGNDIMGNDIVGEQHHRTRLKLHTPQETMPGQQPGLLCSSELLCAGCI